MIQRKTATLCEEYEYICRQDDAVDAPPEPEPADSEEIAAAKKKELAAFDLKWEQYADGKGPCPLVPGGKPTRFTLRHLNTVARGRMSTYLAKTDHDKSAWPEALVAAFVLGVKDVDNCFSADGKAIKLVHDYDDGLHNCPILSADSLNQFDMSVVMEVGSRIIKRLSPDPK